VTTPQVSPSSGGSRRPRIETFDSVRGIYLLFIAAIHLLTNLRPEIYERPALVLLRTAFSGTVAFVTLSGFIAGYAFEANPDRAPVLKARYRSRALKLVLAHPIILLALYDLKRLTVASHGSVWRCWFITDTFAVMFIALVPLLPRLRANARVLLGSASIVVSRVLYVLHPGHSAAALLLMDILFGVHPNGTRVLFENYALLPLSGMFLVGSRLGLGFAHAQAGEQRATLLRRYLLAAVGLFALAAVLLGLGAVLRQGGRNFWRAALYPDYYFTLYPFHVGAMLAMTAVLLRSHWLPSARRFVGVIGRQSLSVYVVQYFVMQWLPFVLKLYGHMTIPGFLFYLPGAILILQLSARAFELPLRWNTLTLATSGAQPAAPPSVRVASPVEPRNRAGQD
jgi:hypothetical protein